MAQHRSAFRAFVSRLVVALVVATLFMGGAVFAVNYVIDRKLEGVARVDVSLASPPPEGANYLLIGSDTRAFVKSVGEEDAFGDEADTGGQRSDTMMVLHVEPSEQRTFVVSFPRDLWVDIPGVGNSKINAAFNDGPDKTIETLRANFGIEINHYLEVDFKSFRGIVNSIGSVPVYFPYPARDQKTGLYSPFPGCVRLDGNAALSYVRSRSLQYFSTERDRWVNADAVPDIDRIARQQDFMRKLAGLAVQKGLNNPLTANKITDRVLENLTIDSGLTKNDIFALIEAFRTIDPDDPSSLEFETLPWTNGPSQGGLSVLYVKQPEADAVFARLADFSGSGGPAGDRAEVVPSDVKLEVRNGTGVVGEAAAALKELKTFGFRGAGTTNDPRGTVKLTEVRYAPGAEDKGKAVLEYVSPSARLVEDPDLKGADVALVLGTNFESIVTPVDPTSVTVPTTVPGALPDAETPVPEETTAAPISNQDQLGEPAPREPPC
ncbi:MAG TPA: LCP family protein [Acidimicrobiia bacterium]|nr:LCP family protein [Acidimicrobiia bacterium]